MAEGTYVAAIDQGTTSSRCMIFGRQGNVVAVDHVVMPAFSWRDVDGAHGCSSSGWVPAACDRGGAGG